MNLADTVKALEALRTESYPKGITVALDIGVHSHCDLDSNCPIAIQLRRLIGDTGITLEQLLEGYQEATVPDPLAYNLPEFNSTLQISIAGKVVELDMNEAISEHLRATVGIKLRDIDRMRNRLTGLGHSLYESYLQEIHRQRDNQTLPQVSFRVSELIGTGCMVTKRDRNYAFLFPSKYSPQYIVKDGIRYKLSDEDINNIYRQIYIQLIISQDKSFIEARVLDESGDKLIHYHGSRDEDCWGAVTLPERWDGRLSSLAKLVHILTMSLTAINYNSLVEREPSSMPYSGDLLNRSTELGREGELDTPPVEQPRQRTGWGAGWRRGRGQTDGGTGELTGAALTDEQETLRRFGETNPGMDNHCALCSHTYGEHNGWYCPAEEDNA